MLATAVTSAALAFSTSGVALRRADAVFAAASALPLGPERARAVIRHATLLRGALLAVMAAGAALSLGWVPPLDDPTPAERASGALLVLDRLAVPLYGLAGWRYLTIGIRSGSPILLALAGACILLAEAMLAVAFARS